MKRTLKQDDAFNLRARVYALWLEGKDTHAMSRELNVPEHECERALHQRLELKRALKDSLEECRA